MAFKEQVGSNSGYMKTLRVAKIHATCFGRQTKSLTVGRTVRKEGARGERRGSNQKDELKIHSATC